MKKKLLVFLLVLCMAVSLFPFGAAAAGDSVATATKITFGNTNYGAISENNTTDFYSFTLPSSGKVSLSALAEIEYVYFRILDASEQQLWSVNAHWNSTSQTSSTTADFHLIAGTYYLVVAKDGSRYGDYQVKLTYTSAGETFPENASSDDNSMKNANSISFGTEYKGQLAMNDTVDFYKMNVTSSGMLQFSAHAYMEYAYFKIFDESGTQLWSISPHWNSTSGMISYTNTLHLIKGVYYFVVQRDGNRPGNYDFKWTFTGAGESFTETADTLNNSMADASKIALNTQYKGQIALNDDIDFYRFAVGNADTVTLSFEGAFEYIYLKLFDENGSQLWSVGPHWNSTTQTINASYDHDLSAGTYYLVIQKDGSRYGNYSFQLTSPANAVAAPKITTQPKSVTVSEGTTVKFTVAASGSDLSYQWQFKAPGTSTWNNSSMTGAKTATLSVAATTARNGQQYRCVVKNSGGSVTSSAATLTVTAAVSAPKITTQPKSVTVSEGSTAKFTVAASGSNLTYQWQYKSPGTSTWYNSGMTGAKTATLSVPATTARSGQQYRCKVTGDGGSVTSSAATLTVTSSSKPVITTQPKSTTAAPGKTVKFTVAASGSNLTYQWQYKSPGTSTWYNSGMTGAKTATLSVPATTARNGQQYRCKVTNANGSVYSSAATLTVTSKLVITSQPKSATANAGETVKFTVVASGSGQLFYQWQFKAPGTTEWHDSSMTGCNSATLTVKATAARNGQQYRCVVMNSSGNITSSAATLTVRK